MQLHQLEWPGKGPPLVLVHGLNNSAWLWSRSADRLASAGLRILAPSMRGHGESDKPATGYDLASTSRDLEAFLDHHRLGTVDLAGHSWGGKMAMHFAATRPERVRSLVLADPAPPRGLFYAFPGLVRAAFHPERRPFPDEQSWKAGMHRLVQHQVGDATDRVTWSAMYERLPDGRYLPRLADEAFDEIVRRAVQQDITPLLARIRCPTLLLIPDISLTPTPQSWRRARQEMPNLQVESVVGDHTFIYTNPLAASAAVNRFLVGRS